MRRLALAAAVSVLAASAAAQPAPPPLDMAMVAYRGPIIAFVHAEVVDGTGAPPRRDQTLVITGGRISALGPSARTPVPAGAHVIEAAGRTLLPGFVMVHEHMFYPSPKGGEYEEYPYSFSRLYLAGGVTTLRTGGSLAPYADINTARAIARGAQPGPDIDATGPYLEGATLLSDKMVSLRDAADATRTVDYWASAGATSFKAYNFLTRAELGAAVAAAHAHGLKITGHLCSITYREAAELGVDNLEHGFFVATDFAPGKTPDVCPGQDAGVKALAALDPDGPELGSLMRLLIAHHVALTSTLTIFESFAAGRPEAPEAARALLTPALRAAYETRWAAVQGSAAGRDWAALLPRGMRMERRFVELGGVLLAGTDPTGYGGVIPGYSARRQVELLVEAGFDFPAALKIATLNGARYLGRDAEVGVLAPGKRADLVVVDGDPATDVRALEAMPLVFKAGVGYRTAVVFERLRGVIGLY